MVSFSFAPSVASRSSSFQLQPIAPLSAIVSLSPSFWAASARACHSPSHPPSPAAPFLLSPLPQRRGFPSMAAGKKGGDPRLQKIASTIRFFPDFPKPGVMFQDITTLLLDHKAFQDSIDIFVERYKDKNITIVAGIEARGFIFGPPIALAIGAKFVPLRKPKKLPGPVISEEYALEYGTDKMEMHVGAVEPGDRGLIVDDLIATGGTLCAAIKLLERAGAEVVECACLIEIPELKGRERLGENPLYILLEGEGEAGALDS